MSLNPIEIFSGTMFEVGMLRSMLSDAGIESYPVDDAIGTLMPWVSSPGGLNPLKVEVAEEDYERAMQVVNDFRENNNQ